ncbi:Epoxyqueuosine reductase, partial [Geodia barretti]
MDGLPWYNAARVRRGTEPEELLPDAKSIICLALNYFPGPRKEAGPTGQIARYARGRDYHRVMKRKMRDLVAALNEAFGTTVAARWYVDDGPMLDRAAAARAGLGWFGKNSNILTSELGSWVFLGQIVTDMDLEADSEIRKTCGSCVACIDSCPTGAIVAPYVIDNNRCISYQTIENRGPIPPELRPKMLDWVFGCDICQEVCPVNRKAQ